MLALYRSGRQAEALEVYRDAREILVEDAGVEPGAELQRLHAAILRQDPSLDLPTPAVEPPRELDADATAPLGGPDVPVAPASDRRSALPAPPNRTIGRAREIGAVGERLRVGLGAPVDPDRAGRRRQDAAGARGRARRRGRLRRRRALRVARGGAATAGRPGGDRRARSRSSPLAGESAEQAVERFLAAKHLLLVVDNCEHLPGAAPFIGGLRGCVSRPSRCWPRAANRSPCRPSSCYPVPPLALPEPGTRTRRRWPTSTPSRCSASARERTTRTSTSATTTPTRSRRSAGASTGCRWRSSWRPRAAGCSPRARSPTRLDGALGALGAGAARRARPPADAARDDRLEPRPAQRRRAGVLRALRGVRRRRHAWRRRRRSPAPASTRSTGSSPRACSCAADDGHGPTRLGMLETVRAYAGERFAAAAGPRSGARAPLRPLTCASLATTGSDSALDGPDTREHLGVSGRRAREPPRRAAIGGRARRRRAGARALRRARRLLAAARSPGRGRAVGPPGAAQDGAPPLIRRCGPARSARCAGRSGIPSARTSFRRCSRRPRRSRGRSRTSPPERRCSTAALRCKPSSAGPTRRS